MPGQDDDDADDGDESEREAADAAEEDEEEDNPAAARPAQLREHRPGVRRRPAVRRQLPRLQHLPRRSPRVAATGHLGRLPRGPGRRVGGRQPADHVRRADPRAARLRSAGGGGTGERPAFPRNPDLRHQRHADAAAGRGGADVPRIAYPYRGGRSRRRGQRLRLRVGNRRGPPRGGARRLLGRVARRGPGHRAVPHRRHPGPAGEPRELGHRQPSVRIPGSRDRRGRGPLARRGPRPRARSGPPRAAAATTSRPSRTPGWPPGRAPATASCWTSPTRSIRCGSTT